MKTHAARQFIDAVRQSWDSPAPWQETARLGLAEVDQDALTTFTDETGEDYFAAEAEVLEYVRQYVAE